VRRIAISALFVLATLAFGQWLDTAFRVPDTFGLPRGLLSLAHDPDLGVMYIAGDESDSILVVDDQTHRPVERFGVGINSGVGALVRPSNRSVLFCALGDCDQVVALDCGTHRAVASYNVGHQPGGLFYCDALSKLYVANWDDSSVSVIDLNTDSVVSNIHGIDTRWLCQWMCYAQGPRRAFCIDQKYSEVVAIDVTSDTVVARIPVGGPASALSYNPANNRVYCACWGGRLFSIDAATCSVATVLPERVWALSLACDSARNRVYVPVESALVVIDGTADTVMGKVAVFGWSEWAAFDSRCDRIVVVNEYSSWCDNPYNVAVINADSLVLVRLLSGPSYLDAVVQWDSNADVFCAGCGMVGVYDCMRCRPVGVLAIGCDVLSLSADSAGGKLYCVTDWPHQVIVIDPATNRVRTSIPLTHYPGPVCFNTLNRKVYVGSEQTEGPGIVTVLDGVGDTLLREVVVGCTPAALAYNPDDDVIYAACDSSISVIDGKADSVIGYAQTDASPGDLVYNAPKRKLYAIRYDGITVVDPLTNRQVKYIETARYVEHYVLNSTGSRLYMGFAHDSLYAFDCVRDTLAGAIAVTRNANALCYDAADDLLYVGSSFSSDSGSLAVIDCATGSVVTVLPVETRHLYYDRQTNAIYVLGYRHIIVIDAQSRTVLRTFATGFHPELIASSPGLTGVYVCDGAEIAVIRKASGPAEMAVQATPDAQATVVRGRLNWTGTLAVMYDKCGRRVADVHSGGNDVSRLQPGVYFIRQNGVRRGTYARKVVVTR
jgi:YVTN family beta-propeller protein